MKDLSELIAENIKQDCIWYQDGIVGLVNVPIPEILNLLDAYTREKLAPLIKVLKRDIAMHKSIDHPDISDLLDCYLTQLENTSKKLL